MDKPVFEKSIFTDDRKLWNKHPHMGLNLKCNNWLWMSTLADSTKLQYTESKFILNKFPSRCDRCFLNKVKNSYFD